MQKMWISGLIFDWLSIYAVVLLLLLLLFFYIFKEM